MQCIYPILSQFFLYLFFHTRANRPWLYQRLTKKEFNKRSRRTFRPEMPMPNPDLYITSQPCSGLSHTPLPLLPPPVLGFPTPTSPVAPSAGLEMLGSHGVNVDSSDDDGDDDEDEFEDSEQTEATATEVDLEECATSEGELSATSEGGTKAVDKWVAVKEKVLPPPSQLLPDATVVIVPPTVQS
jgi:hypothetical protein